MIEMETLTGELQIETKKDTFFFFAVVPYVLAKIQKFYKT